jgi:hypothetical protein
MRWLFRIGDELGRRRFDSTWIRSREIKRKGLSEEIWGYYNIGREEAKGCDT